MTYSYVSHFGYKIIGTNGTEYREHKHIAEQHLGRKLTKDEVVHHLNGDKLDNRINNLLVVTRSWHKKIHGNIGFETRFKTKHKLAAEEVFKKYKELKNHTQVASYFGCSQPTITRFLNTLTEYKQYSRVKDIK